MAAIGQVNTPLLGYPTKMGNKIREIFDHTGPKSYSNIGTNSGTGDVINASDFGVGGFEEFISSFGGWLEGYSNTGNFIVKIFTSSSGTTPSQSALANGAALSKVVMQWFTTSTAFGAISTEVTNTTDLSGESVRLSFWAV